MSDLSRWFEAQHHGLHAFRAFQNKLSDLSRREPEHSAACQLLSDLVEPYIDAFDEAPLPVDTADLAHRRLAELLATIDFCATPEQRLADLNRIANYTLAH
jgi:hypothetical protein